MIDVTTRIEIARPVPEVFAFVADQTHAPQWQTSLHEVRRLTDGPIGVGCEHEFVRTSAGRRFTSRNHFVVFEPDRLVEFEIPAGWITGIASYRTDAIADMGTALVSRMRFSVRGPLSSGLRLQGPDPGAGHGDLDARDQGARAGGGLPPRAGRRPPGCTCSPP